MDVTGHPQENRLRHHLDRGGQVHLSLGERAFRRPRRPFKKSVELARGHRQPLGIVEIGLVHPERAVVLQVDQVIEDELREPRVAIGGQAHQLVFAAVDPEAAIIGHGRVEQAERVREAELMRQVDRGPSSDAKAGGGPLADAVDGQDGGLLERRRVEGAGGVGLVVLGEEEPLPVGSPEGFRHRPREEQLFSDPERQRLDERREPGGRVGQIRLEEPFKLEQGLVVEADPVQVGGGEASLGQATGDGFRRERGSCFLRVKRSSWAAATTRPSTTSAAAESW